MTVQAEVTEAGRRVRVSWPDGFRCEFAARWLFDHAEEARDPVSRQRRHGVLALETAAAVASADVVQGWLRLRLSATGQERSIGLERLRAASAPQERVAELWLQPGPVADPYPVRFDDYLRDDQALRETLSRVARRGLAVLTGAGREPGTVEGAVERFGFLRETNYGRVFDVRIEADAGNLAFTDRGLELHTDNPYRDPVPTLQLLHAITADNAGGETLFVDGFAHAELLRREAPDAFEILARVPVRFAFAAKSGALWSAQAPVLSLDPRGRLEAVRMNHRSLDLEHRAPEVVEAWYAAYLDLHRRLHAPGAAFERRLEPGDIVIFDNRRILHGRRALTTGSPRWLQGCYADRDGLLATLARLDRPPAQDTTDAGQLHR